MTWVLAILAIVSTLVLLFREAGIMADYTEVKNKLDAIETKVADVAAEVAELKNKPQLVTQEQLDSLDAQMTGISNALDAAK